MKNSVMTITECEVCNNKNLISVLNLGKHPMCDDLIPVDEQRTCYEYPIEILLCTKCITAHQKYQIPKCDLFPLSYHYRSHFTADVINGMRNLVESCLKDNTSLTNKKVLDIGCNDGTLLDLFKEKGAITFGIEPTGAHKEASIKGHVIYNDFISINLAQEFVKKNGHVDIITFTNVFAHIENLREVIASLKILMSPDTLIVIENHYLGAILNNNQFDTFYHEHPRSYSFTSFEYIAESLCVDLLDVKFPARYGGNIRVYLGKKEFNEKFIHTYDFALIREAEMHFSELFLNLQNKINCWLENKTRIIKEIINKNGKLRAKAFPGRAAILIKLLGLNEELISAVYEKPGSLKIGHFLPGTRIPIRSDEELFSSNDKTAPILNLAWHIPKEISLYMNANNYHGPIIDIINEYDFIPTTERIA